MNQEHIVFTVRIPFTLEAGIIALEELSNKIHKLNKNSYLASFNHERTRAFFILPSETYLITYH